MQPFTVRYKGSIEIDCPSMDDAIALAQKLAMSNGVGGHATSAASASGNLEVTRYRELAGYLNNNQRKFLALLIENPHGKTDHALCQELGLDSNKALGGMLSGLSKHARRVGIDPDSIWSSEWKKVGDNKTKEFRVQADFKKIALEGALK